MWMLLPLIAALLVVACAPVAPTTPTPPVPPSPAPSPGVIVPPSPMVHPQAVARLRNRENQVTGLATFTEGEGGVQIRVTVVNLAPGRHGMHIHEVGQCEPADFLSAGGHFNPDNREHGIDNPRGPHAGDLPNLEVGPDGSGTIIVTTDRVTLGGGPASLFDPDGSALVIHAEEDDQRTDPAGNSGERVACGAIERA